MVISMPKDKVIIKGLLWLLAGVLLLSSCRPGNSPSTPETGETTGTTASYRRISAKQARQMMEQTEGYILLDVRTEPEFREKRIEGAMLLPDYDIAARAEQELPDKQAVILVYCRTGRRSELAARQLMAMGYTQVYDFGGIVEWPYQTVSG